MRSNNVINFPVQPAEIERSRVYRDEPCTILLFTRRQPLKPPGDFTVAVPTKQG